jgi:hypothetical protein
LHQSIATLGRRRAQQRALERARQRVNARDRGEPAQAGEALEARCDPRGRAGNEAKPAPG